MALLFLSAVRQAGPLKSGPIAVLPAWHTPFPSDDHFREAGNMRAVLWRLAAAVSALLPTMYSPCGWARTTPGSCDIANPDAGLGIGALASMIVRGNSPVFWLTVIESALLLFAFPALLVALTGKWRGRRFARAVTAFLVAGGCVNVLANAFGRVLGSERFLVVVFDALPVNGRDLPSI
ncbi:hypothetical protein AB0C27_28710 [Nonomuraea sp. NPDC048882]|uniref:hypothetical protein n=1 Tax=Nonomuraea sp. NPDC048882 TaxID=3154347 RepID=UPI0033FD77F7